MRIDNKDLIEKYRSNTELESLVTKLNEHVELLKKINATEIDKDSKQVQLAAAIALIEESILRRRKLIDDLMTNIQAADQSVLGSIRFGAEYGFDEKLEDIVPLNIKEKTDFVEGNEIKLEEIRKRPADFLKDIYSKKQKIISRHDPKEVAGDMLTLTEKILFTAEMEGDKIGGFSEPTMTPGKRALFALKLILAESDDTWPLLIDQPEDDLDSRSIYDDVVPFLKEKKRERQIIMVSHNANLVIGADSEEVIVANRNGNDRKNRDGKEFNYLTGSLEYSMKKDGACTDTLESQGICEHACEILDGGKQAFESRKNKYNIK